MSTYEKRTIYTYIILRVLTRHLLRVINYTLKIWIFLFKILYFLEICCFSICKAYWYIFLLILAVLTGAHGILVSNTSLSKVCWWYPFSINYMTNIYCYFKFFNFHLGNILTAHKIGPDLIQPPFWLDKIIIEKIKQKIKKTQHFIY